MANDFGAKDLARKLRRASAVKGDEIVYQRDIPRQQSNSRHHKVPDPSGPITLLEEEVSGSVALTEHGSCFCIVTPVAGLDIHNTLEQRYKEMMCNTESLPQQRMQTFFETDALQPDKLVFMDIETTGLGSSPVFLIGVLIWNGTELEIRQYLARDYSEEAACIELYVEACMEKHMLITFNGKSFDSPFIRARAAANRIVCEEPFFHFDLLHECRRIWRDYLPNCKLQTLESLICRRPRHGDIPGHEIPEAYHRYVRTKDAWQIIDILKHNALDLVTLADLLTYLPAAPPERKPKK